MPRFLYCFLGFAATSSLITARGAGDEIDFNRDIRPILSDNCYYCHGPDEDKREGDLRLDIREEAIDAFAIVPGDSAESELVLRILNEDPEELMPRPSTNKTLTDEEKQLLIRWIDEGGKYDAHWSYVPIEKPSYPSIDAIVAEELADRKLSFSPEADKRTLIRRVSLDLIGLPPTPEAVEAFLVDKAPDAYERLVDRLLASPRYGERIAIPWLDAVRYADTVGYHGDQERDATPYRDYVIDAFNANKPYDEFTIEQIAGDLLANATLEQKVAASYNRLNQISREGGIQDKEYVKKYQAERVRTTATAWLGSTMACCECHDHKFDPFTTKDFYSMAAFFSDILEKGAYTGDGAYQEEIDPYLNDPLENEGWFGPELTVSNETFHPDPQAVKDLIAVKESELAKGSAAANEEFKLWLQQQKTLSKERFPHTAPLVVDAADGKGKITLAAPHPIVDHLAAIHFDVNIQGGSGLIELQIDYQVGDDLKSKGYSWGTPRETEGIPKKQVGETLRMGQWHALQLAADDMDLPAGAQLLAITPLKGSQSYKNLRLRYLYKGSQRASLSPEGQVALEALFSHPQADASALQREFFVDHAQAFATQRHEIDALKESIYGIRFTPLTISATPREVKVLPRGCR